MSDNHSDNYKLDDAELNHTELDDAELDSVTGGISGLGSSTAYGRGRVLTNGGNN